MEIYYVACFIAVATAEIRAQGIQRKIAEYFDSDIVRSFQSTWTKYKRPLENAVLLAIKENYGHKAMNVYVRRMQDPYRIAKGYCHSDNQVQIALADLELDDLPHLWMPEVTLLLPSNLMQIGASLSKMIIRSNYVVFRNKSQLIYDTKDQNIYESSPFRFQQVHTMGQVGISIEGCIITGMAVTALVGSSVNLRFNTFRLSQCQYTFEIYKHGLGSPPVVAKYYPMGAGLNIEDLILRSLRQELLPKVQAALFSFVNTSAILEDRLYELRKQQEELFRHTTQFLNDVIRSLNKIAMEKNSGVVDMEDFKVTWNDTFDGSQNDTEITLNKLVLSGLETAYSTHTGGPHMQMNPQISEEIRFSVLRVRGNITYKGAINREYQFIAEIQDVAVEVLVNVNMLSSRKMMVKLKSPKNQHRFHVTGWRNLELAVPKSHFVYTDALLTGYLLNTIPKYINNHLQENFDKAIEGTAGKVGKLSYEKHPEEEHEGNAGEEPLPINSDEENEEQSSDDEDPQAEDSSTSHERETLIRYIKDSVRSVKKLSGKRKDQDIRSKNIKYGSEPLSPAESSGLPVNAEMITSDNNEIISEK